MKQQNFDFSNIDWSKIDREKAEFMYNEALGRLDAAHRNNDGITNNALGMLTLAVPPLAALTGFFAVRWGALATPFFAASVCAALVLFAIIVLLLVILLPRSVNSGQAEPRVYFTNNFYMSDMGAMLQGNIQSAQKMIDEDHALTRFRGTVFRAAVLLFSALPALAGCLS
jgi:membrane protein implicated in regulation of membrane protease activity